MELKKRIFVCSRLSGDFEKNIENVKRYCLYVADRGFAPFAPHLFCTQFLSDKNLEHRRLGIDIGLAFLSTCSEMWAFFENIEFWSNGMQIEREFSEKNSIIIRKFVDIGTDITPMVVNNG